MGKNSKGYENNKNKNNQKHQEQGRQEGRQVNIDKDALEFAKITLKKYKKHNDFYDSKKELKQAYAMYLIDLLPRTIQFIVKFGYIKTPEVQETKDAIYAKLVDEDFIKALKKEIKHNNKIKNIKLLPIIIKDILMISERENREILAKDPNGKIYDMTDLVELSQMILKKKLKKMDKAGIDANIAFDVLSIIPGEEALSCSQNYRIHMLYECLYEHSKTKKIPFKEIMEVAIDEEFYPVFISFALLERKEKFGNLTDAQKVFYLDVSTWAFETMENSSRETIEAILKTFVNGRKRDEAQGKDSNRRYALGSLSEADYPKIAKSITRMISDDGNLKKFF